MPAKEDHERFTSLAEELGIEDDDRENFISSAMERKGYKKRTAWDDPDPDPDKDGKGGNRDAFGARKPKDGAGGKTTGSQYGE